jgi:hypothetical protein
MASIQRPPQRGRSAPAPAGLRSTVFSIEDEAVLIAISPSLSATAGRFFYALQPTIPHLGRSALHGCLQRRSISRLPEVGGDKHAKQRFKRDPIGYFHISCTAAA